MNIGQLEEILKENVVILGDFEKEKLPFEKTTSFSYIFIKNQEGLDALITYYKKRHNISLSFKKPGYYKMTKWDLFYNKTGWFVSLDELIEEKRKEIKEIKELKRKMTFYSSTNRKD